METKTTKQYKCYFHNIIYSEMDIIDITSKKDFREYLPCGCKERSLKEINVKWVKVDDIKKIIHDINIKITEDCYIIKESIKCQECNNDTIVYTYIKNKLRICISCMINYKFNELSQSKDKELK